MVEPYLVIVEPSINDHATVCAKPLIRSAIFAIRIATIWADAAINTTRT
jgi:hypothetical protein